MGLAFTEDDLRNAAGPASFERGLGYRDCVEELEVGAEAINAIVVGTYEYDVTLAVERGALTGDCSCPWAQEGNFCKHCVAVGIAALEAFEEAGEGGGAPAALARPDVEGWLESLAEAELRDELRTLVRENRELRRRFELRIAREKRDAGQVRSLAHRLLRLGAREYIDFEYADEYAARIVQTTEAISGLIDAGMAEDAVGLTRMAVRDAVAAHAHADDSNGSIADALCGLTALHLQACEAAAPDPLELADYLADHNLAHAYDFGYDFEDYVDLLGGTGWVRLREVIEEAYRRDPKGAGEKLLMETLVRYGGDLDELVRLLARDLDQYGRQHLRIAIELDSAGRGEEGLEWAEAGLREATGFVGTDLVEFVALRYTQAGRFKDLLNLRRERFADQLTVSNYDQLRTAAQSLGTWDSERRRAMALLRKDSAKQGAKAHYGMGPVLIEVMMSEGDYIGAWEQSFKASSEPQRIKLAATIRNERPEEALSVYERALAPLRGQTGDDVYRRAGELLQGIQACHRVLGTPEEFTRFLTEFRADQKRKRNLMKLLDASGLTVS